MDASFIAQLLLVISAIWMGMRMRGIGLGVMGAAGLLVLTLCFKVSPQAPSLKVLLAIIASITTAAALESAGSLDLLTYWVERLLLRHPNYLLWMSPLLTYVLVFFMGTSHIIYPLLPIIIEVAQRHGIAPVKPLVASVLASQQALLASPVSVITTITLSHLQEKKEATALYGAWLRLLPATLLGTLAATLVVCLLHRKSKVTPSPSSEVLPIPCTPKPHAKRALLLFLLGVCGVAFANGTKWLVDADGKPIDPTYLVAMVMLTTAATIFFFVGTQAVRHGRIFHVGMQAVVAVMGLTWLSKSFLHHHKAALGIWMTTYLSGKWPWAVLLFLTTIFSSSQSATIESVLPHALSVLPPLAIYAILPAANSFYLLPSYPTILAAVALDKTGSTRVGRWVLNHSFLLPGLAGTLTTLATSYLFYLVSG